VARCYEQDGPLLPLASPTTATKQRPQFQGLLGKSLTLIIFFYSAIKLGDLKQIMIEAKLHPDMDQVRLK
jgi:hypothetical protein